MVESKKGSVTLEEKKKRELNNKIDKMWRKSSSNHHVSKRLIIKLECSGSTKQKLFLKLECNANKVQDRSYNNISELLKDFFSNNP